VSNEQVVYYAQVTTKIICDHAATFASAVDMLKDVQREFQVAPESVLRWVEGTGRFAPEGAKKIAQHLGIKDKK
jgi:hypothetical protein